MSLQTLHRVLAQRSRQRASRATHLVLAVCMTACAGGPGHRPPTDLWQLLEQKPVQRPVLTRAEVLAYFDPPAAPAPTAPVPAAASAVLRAQSLVASGDGAGLDALRQAKASTNDAAELAALRCLLSDALDDTSGLRACADAIAAAPAALWAPLAVRVLAAGRERAFAPAQDVASKAQQTVAACAAAGGRACDVLARSLLSIAPRSAATALGAVGGGVLIGPFARDEEDLRGASVAPALFASGTPYGGPLASAQPQVESARTTLHAARAVRRGIYRYSTTVAARGEVRLVLETRGAARVTIDGTEVLSDMRATGGSHVATAAVALNGDVHEVNVWLTALAASGFRLIAQTPDGRAAFAPAAFVPAAFVPAAVQQPAAAPGAVTVLKARRAALAPLLDGEPGTWPRLVALLWSAIAARAPALSTDAEPMQLAHDVLAGYGGLPVAVAAAALTLEEYAGLTDTAANTVSDPLWRKVLAALPNHAQARLRLARRAWHERPDDVIALYRQLRIDVPADPRGARDFVSVALENGRVDEALGAAQALLTVETSAQNIDAALPAFRAAAAWDDVAKLEQKRAALATPDDEPLAWPAYLLRRGETDAAVKALTVAATADDEPIALSTVDLIGLRDPRAAQAMLVGRAQRGGRVDARAALRAVRLTAQLDGVPQARRALATQFPPTTASLLRANVKDELSGTRLDDAMRADAEAALARRRALAGQPFAGYPAGILIDDFERHLAIDHSSLSLRHFMVELVTDEALDQFGEIAAQGDQLLRVRAIKPDGTVLEPELHAGVDDVSLPGLSVGDIVDVIAAGEDGPGGLANTGYELRVLEGSLPAWSHRYVVTMPEELVKETGVEPIARNGAAPPLRTTYVDDDGVRRERWEFVRTDVAAVRPEPAAPLREETAALVGFMYGVDEATWWGQRVAQIERAARIDPLIAATAARLGAAGACTERMERAFGLAVSIEPGAELSATAALIGGAGARTPLFLALARAAGLTATPVALHSDNAGPRDLPTANTFSSVGVVVSCADGEHVVFVDGAATIDGLPPGLAGAAVLARTPQTQALSVTPLPPTAIDAAPLEVNVDLAWDKTSPEPTLAGYVLVTAPRARATSMRQALRRASDEDLVNILESGLSASFPGCSVSAPRIPDLASEGAPLHFGARLRVPVAPGSDGSVRFEHLFADGAGASLHLSGALSSVLGVAERQLPLVVFADREVLTVRLALPPGARFVEVPAPLKDSVGPYALEQTSDVTDGVLVWQRTLRAENSRISPALWRTVRKGLVGLAGQTDGRVSFAWPAGWGDAAQSATSTPVRTP